MLVRVHLVLSRQSAAGVDEDAAITTHDFDLGLGAGTINRDEFATDTLPAWSTFCTTLAARMRGVYIFDQLRWYDLEGDESLFGEPFLITELNIAGTENTTSVLPPQVALSVTERTAERKRWGRFYLCGFTSAQLDSYGRWGSSICTLVADATDVLYEACAFQGGNPVVFSRQNIAPDDQWESYDIQKIQVDDVPDVIRRRRFEQTNLRVQREITP